MPVALRILVAVVLLLCSTTAIESASAKPACPDARTCTLFSLKDTPGVWPTDPDGVARLRYVIREPMPASVPLATFRGAIAAAARTWNRAGAKVELIDAGVVPATYVPTSDIDGMIMWADIPGAHAWEDTIFLPGTNPDGVTHDPLRQKNRALFVIGFSQAIQRWSWHPCGGPQGPCSSITTEFGQDLQHLATHELGHALGLAHVDGPDSSEMTMATQVSTCEFNATCRHASTLALGDILGVRALFGSRPGPVPRVERP